MWEIAVSLPAIIHCLENDTFARLSPFAPVRDTFLVGLYKIQTHERFIRTLIYYDTDTQSTNFRGDPLCQVTKQHLNNETKQQQN